MSNRNKVRQVITNKDGSKKVVFHNKPTHAPQFADRKEIWNWANKQPKPNSKRQQKIREELLKGTLPIESDKAA